MAFRTEKDSIGPIQVPSDALFQAQTQRASLNFPYGERHRMPESFVKAMALLKSACAEVNCRLGLLPEKQANAIAQATAEIVDGKHVKEAFPVSIFQTGSGTSTNMNMNEVVSTLGTRIAGEKVHPNDHVNCSQSSNDTVPSSMHVAFCLESHRRLLPAMKALSEACKSKGAKLKDVVTTGRTHLMDAMPVTMEQVLGGWAAQLDKGARRIESALSRARLLAIGGTAVGSGINAHPEFGKEVAAELAKRTGIAFEQNDNLFEALSAADASVELSGQLKTVACSLMKIANDLRWYNSGPGAGIAEIALEAVQPGSSIMPGKVNAVIPESACMVCAQVIGNDAAVAIGGQAGNFQLNVMLPMIAANVLSSIDLLATVCTITAKCVSGFAVNKHVIAQRVRRNPVLVTGLNPIIGYDLGAKLAKQAWREGRELREVALESDKVPQNVKDNIDKLLDPMKLAQGGIVKKANL